MCFPGWTGELKPISGFLSAALSASQHGTRQAPFGKCQKSTSTKLSPTVFHDRFFGWINMVKLEPVFFQQGWMGWLYFQGLLRLKGCRQIHLYCINWWATCGISKYTHVFIVISHVDIFIYTCTGHIAMKPVTFQRICPLELRFTNFKTPTHGVGGGENPGGFIAKAHIDGPYQW